MVKTIQSDIDPVDRVISRLYRWAMAVPPGQYRTWALEQVQRVIPHDGALWGSGSRSALKFHTVTLKGLPSDYPAALEATTAINPILPHLLEHYDVPADMSQVMADEKFYDSEIYRRAFLPFGIERILSMSHMDRRSSIYSLVSLYRSDRSHRFTELEKHQHKRLSYHLFNAASHAFFLHLLKTQPERPLGAGAAVVDQHGNFHEAQPRFLEMLDERFPNRQPQQLPFKLPDAGQTLCFQDLMVRGEAQNDLLLLTLWPAGPLDRLTSREREIVHCVAQGLSFKQAAKKIGVAPSTVANHLYRVYRKLGVYSRTELASLVYPDSTTRN
ncbi:MAG TPA: helix-turn-helix transcriptional regulator [Solimonas sp.]|nr:helix-turn-helix transcriptional regulator [Solimonas sp.]